jgi:hypothetical protein
LADFRNLFSARLSEANAPTTMAEQETSMKAKRMTNASFIPVIWHASLRSDFSSADFPYRLFIAFRDAPFDDSIISKRMPPM